MRIILAVTALALAVVQPAVADLPRTMNVQAFVATSGGTAATGTYDMDFGLYATPTGGSALWSQALASVPVNAGIADVVLGPVPEGVLEAQVNLWVGVVVEGEALPRQRLLPTAWALVAQKANVAVVGLDLQCSGCVSAAEVDFPFASAASKGGAALDLACSGCVGPSDLAANAVGPTHIQDGAVGVADVSFPYAGSPTKGGPAADVACAGCVGTADLAANLTLAGDVTVTGGLQACSLGQSGCALRTGDAALRDTGDGWLVAQTGSGLRLRSADNGAWRPLEAGGGTFHAAVAVDPGGLTVAGDVGVGTASPQAKLHVVGTTILGGAVTVSGSIIGAGALELSGLIKAQGSVQLGNDGATCASGKAGTLRWTGAALQICNGAAWVAVGSGGGGGSGDGTTQNKAAQSCLAIVEAGAAQGDGFYWIDPDGGATDNAFQVYCDMTTDGGGWTRVLNAVQVSNWSTVRVSQAAVLAGTSDHAGNNGLNGWVGLSSWPLLGDELREVCSGGPAGSQDVTAAFSLNVGSNYQIQWDIGGNWAAWHNGRELSTSDYDRDSWSSACVNYGGHESSGWGWHYSCHIGSAWFGSNGMPICHVVPGATYPGTIAESLHTQWFMRKYKPSSGPKDGSSKSKAAKDCAAILAGGHSNGSGDYWIDPDGEPSTNAFKATCDMTTDGGGWTRVLNAVPVADWSCCRVNQATVLEGSGLNATSTGTNGWVGLKYWPLMGDELREDCTGGSAGTQSRTGAFSLDVGSNYAIQWDIGGNWAGWHNGRQLSTTDYDRDLWSSACVGYTGHESSGWGWHYSCHIGSAWFGSNGKPICHVVPGATYPGTVSESAHVEWWVRSFPSSAGDPDGSTKSQAGKSCQTILQGGFSTGDGLYWIDPNEGTAVDAFQAYCDMTTDGGGWTRVLNAVPVSDWSCCRVNQATVLAGSNETGSTTNGWVGLEHWPALGDKMRQKCSGATAGNQQKTGAFSVNPGANWQIQWDIGGNWANWHNGRQLSTTDHDRDLWGDACVGYTGHESSGWGWHYSCHIGSAWFGSNGMPICHVVPGATYPGSVAESAHTEWYLRF